jgi:hypothetical protein
MPEGEVDHLAVEADVEALGVPFREAQRRDLAGVLQLLAERLGIERRLFLG